jgi:phosphoadenosine phosphosulfate reductase
MTKEQLEKLNNEYKNKSPQEILSFVISEFGIDLKVASSLGVEDQVITQMVTAIDKNVKVFVLDTGRLHQETYDVLDQTKQAYKVNYEIYFPDTSSVENLLKTKGPNSFYQSIENRKECCGIRKVEPLNRALSTAKAWVTGLRQSQSVTRAELPVIEWDNAHNIVKVNPLALWSEKDVWNFVEKNNVPTNRLHKQGYPSIGCAPCTRAIKEGEDVRAGRWFWESPDQKECGLHIK